MRRVRVLIAVACALALAGCGRTIVRHVTTTITRPTAPTQTTATSAGETTAHTGTATHATAGTATAVRSGRGGGSPLAGRTPPAILASAARALRRVGGYAMRADLVQDHQRTIIDLAATSRMRYEASTTTGRSMFELIALAKTAYLRGNAAFWRAQAGTSRTARARTRAYANRWLTLPASGRHSITRSLGTLAPGTLARCLVEDHGTLTIAGHATVDHRRAVIVADAGNAPGATPSTIAVAATGTPYPLRYAATGQTRPGGPIDVCNDGKGDGATGTITLSQFGQTPPLRAPTGAHSGPGNVT
jgi:hypothetical protein